MHLSLSKVGLAILLCLALSAPVIGTYERIFVLIFENTDRAVALADPNFASLLSRGLLLDNFYATTHPSQPNYIALVAGDQLGVTTNNMYNLTDEFIVNLLEAKTKTWKSYQENYPGDCFIVAKSADALYVRKHNPFMSFTLVSEDTAGRCLNVVPATQLQTDLNNGELPNFMFFTPNMNNGAHDTSISFAGNWINSFLPPLLDYPKFMNGTLVIVTFDEGYTNSAPEDNKVYTLLIGEGVPAGKKTSQRYDHFSLLRTIEDNFNLGTLGRSDATAIPVNFTLYDVEAPNTAPSEPASNPTEPTSNPTEPARNPTEPTSNPSSPSNTPLTSPTSIPIRTPKTQTVSSATSLIASVAALSIVVLPLFT